MRTISEQKVGRSDAALNWSSQIIGFTRVLAGVWIFTLFQGTAQALTGSYHAAMAWNDNPGLGITGYRVYYGVASGNYSNSVAVGNVTTNTISGLVGGVTYFFAVTASNATGTESGFSNEVSYTPGVPGVMVRLTSAGQPVLIVSGLIGHTYDVQATLDFKVWTIIGTVAMGAGLSGFTDTNAASFSKRFYRTRDTKP